MLQIFLKRALEKENGLQDILTKKLVPEEAVMKFCQEL